MWLILGILNLNLMFGQVSDSPNLSSQTWQEPKTQAEANTVRRVSQAAVDIYMLLNSIAMYKQDFGCPPASVEELIELEYLELSEPATLWWKFKFNGDTLVDRYSEDGYAGKGFRKITEILAIENDHNDGQVNDTLSYSVVTGEFGGRMARFIAPEVLSRLVEYPASMPFQPSGTRATIGPIYNGKK